MTRGEYIILAFSLGVIILFIGGSLVSILWWEMTHPTPANETYIPQLYTPEEIALWGEPETRNEKVTIFRRITDPLAPLVRNAQLDEIGEVAVFHGRFLIWDLEGGEMIDLPADREAMPGDKQMTIFFVFGRQDFGIGKYVSEKTGEDLWLRGEEATVVPVEYEYPNYRLLGKKVISTPPPPTIYSRGGFDKIYVNPEIIDWVTSRPTVNGR